MLFPLVFVVSSEDLFCSRCFSLLFLKWHHSKSPIHDQQQIIEICFRIFFGTRSRAHPRLTVLGPSVIAMFIRNETALPSSKVERLKNQKTLLLRLLLRDVAGKVSWCFVAIFEDWTNNEGKLNPTSSKSPSFFFLGEKKGLPMSSEPCSVYRIILSCCTGIVISHCKDPHEPIHSRVLLPLLK